MTFRYNFDPEKLSRIVNADMAASHERLTRALESRADEITAMSGVEAIEAIRPKHYSTTRERIGMTVRTGRQRLCSSAVDGSELIESQ